MNINPIQMIQEFNNFKNNFRGNPQQEVQRLLQSGQMTQQELNKLQKTASEFQKMMQMMK
ncbi:MAG: hypothetical protein KBT03_12865 [Bacteroidales bacterium]|nr:hypothetical protein [Candidatus Scybalousia scybalohippi]